MPTSERIKRILRRTIALFLAVAVALAAFGWIERERNEREEYEVYSAYLSDGLLNDAHDWSTGGSVQVVMANRTISGENLRFPFIYLLDRRVEFRELQTSTRASYLARNLYRTRIESRFSLPRRAVVRITSDAEYGSPKFQENFPRNMGLVVFSGVGFNWSKTQAVFYINHYCGLCGGGRYALMEKVNGVWIVKDEHYTWIS